MQLSVNEDEFIEKLRVIQDKMIKNDSKIEQKMIEWMEKLDFSKVYTFKISDDHLIMLDEYFESTYQTESEAKRIYNSWTNLPKTIRSYLRINGERLGDIDIANAQAIFLNKVITEKLEKEGEVMDETTLQFIQWAELGKAFELLNGMENFGTGAEREKFKRDFWSYIMDRNHKSPTYDIHEKVKFRIPQIIKEINGIKQKDHTRMAYLLQKEESKAIFAFYEEVMDVFPCSPLHDAIYFPVSKWWAISHKMKKKFEEMKIRCTLKWSAKLPSDKWAKSGREMTFIPDSEQLALINTYPKVFKNYDKIHFHSILEDEKNNPNTDEDGLSWLNENYG